MLYCCLFRRIHWAAAITSLVRAMPWSSITSIETMPAVGAAPACLAAAPAARPATKVPWPRPSPARVTGQRGHVHLRANPAGEVAPVRLDAGVDEGDRRRAGAVAAEAREIGPEAVDADGRGPELVGGEILSLLAVRVLLLDLRALPGAQAVEDDRRVGNDHEARGLGERRQVAGPDLARPRRPRSGAACCRRCRTRRARPGPCRRPGRSGRSRARRHSASRPPPSAGRARDSCFGDLDLPPEPALAASGAARASTSSARSPRLTAALRPSEPRPPRPVPQSPLERVSPQVPPVSFVRKPLPFPRRARAAVLSSTRPYARGEALISPLKGIRASNRGSHATNPSIE